MSDFLDRYQDHLEYLTGGVPVAGEVSLTPVDIAATMMSAGQNYSNVFHAITVDTHNSLITGTTRAEFSQTGEVLNADAAAARYAKYAKIAKIVGVSLGLAGTAMEAVREYNDDNVAGTIREGTTGVLALGGATLLGMVVAPIATTAALAIGGGTVAAAAATVTIVATTAGLAVAITNYSDSNATQIESQIVVGAEFAAEQLGIEFSNDPQEFMKNFMESTPDHDVLIGRDFENIVNMLQSAENYPALGLAFDADNVPEGCFAAGTMIDMWPKGNSVSENEDFLRDSHKMEIWQKRIENIVPGDLVLSFDKLGNLKPGKVARLLPNAVDNLLDFFGTGVTPGHVYFRADSHKSHKFETLIDILREDGALQKTDGTIIRASTGVEVGGPLDVLVSVVIGEVGTDGDVIVSGASKLRAGHRVIMDDGSEFTLAQIIEVGGGNLMENGLVATEANPEGGPFHWVFGEELPKPEDYVLKKSGVTLEDIYRANEWEDMRPKSPAPLSVRAPAVDQIQ